MRQPISRRHVLRGLGAAISLPFLEAMLPSMASAQTSPNKRYLAMVFPNGVHPDSWINGSTFGPILSPLVAPYRNYVTVLGGNNGVEGSGINNRPGQASGGGAHEAESSSTLTCATVPPQGGGGFAAAPRLYYADGSPQMSIDQYLADTVGAQSRRKSLCIAPLNDRVFLQAGYHIDNVRYLSWRGSTPVPVFSTISALFNDIFSGGNTGGGVDPAIALRNAKKQSILDFVKDASASLTKKLGAEDNRRMASYFESIREVEKKFQSMPPPTQPQCSSAGAPNNVATPSVSGIGMDTWTKANLDLIVLAFQCGHTKIAAYHMASGGSCMSEYYRYITNPDLVDYHHNYSHYQNINPVNSWNTINRWFVERLVYVMQKMMAINEGGPTMLDNSMILFMSGMWEGHRFVNLPVIVAGKGGGTLTPAGGVRAANGANLAAVHLTMAQKMGANLTAFGKVSTDATVNTSTIQL